MELHSVCASVCVCVCLTENRFMNLMSERVFGTNQDLMHASIYTKYILSTCQKYSGEEVLLCVCVWLGGIHIIICTEFCSLLFFFFLRSVNLASL